MDAIKIINTCLFILESPCVRACVRPSVEIYTRVIKDREIHAWRGIVQFYITLDIKT